MIAIDDSPLLSHGGERKQGKLVARKKLNIEPWLISMTSGSVGQIFKDEPVKE